jgi:hypothetical protein
MFGLKQMIKALGVSYVRAQQLLVWRFKCRFEEMLKVVKITLLARNA